MFGELVIKLYSLVFRFGGPVALATVLEPVAHLRGGQAGRLGQLALLPRRRVRVRVVPVDVVREGGGWAKRVGWLAAGLFEGMGGLQECESSEVNEDVPVAKDAARLLLEAVGGLLAVPDGARQRELAANPVLADRAQRPAADLLRLQVVRLHPEALQLRMRAGVEAVALQQLVQLLEVLPGCGSRSGWVRDHNWRSVSSLICVL